MNKNTIFTISIAILFGLAIILIFGKDIMKKIRAKRKAKGTKDTPTFPLRVGSEGKEVEQLQRFLAKRFSAKFPKYGFDGKFGEPETLLAVKKHLGREEVSEELFRNERIGDFAVGLATMPAEVTSSVKSASAAASRLR